MNPQKTPRTKRRMLSIVLVGLLFILTAQGCGNRGKPPEPDPINLTYWSVFREKSDIEALITQYKALKPHVTITYRNLRFTEYESELVNGFSLDRGPDIFSIHNDWLPKYRQRLAPIPQDMMTLREYQSSFAEVATDDFVQEGQIWAVPLSIDTLALYYNKDHFNQANLPSPPENWKEFRDHVKLLTKTGSLGNFTQHGAAMGTATNINRSVDILYVLMLQNQTPMTNTERTRATFDQSIRTPAGETFVPGREALQFYTDFSSPSKDVYTYNPRSDFSIDAFAQGRASMMMNYSFQAKAIRALSPDLNFDIATMPQIEGANNRGEKVNFANYFGEVVSNKSINQREAWEFLTWITQKQQLATFLETSNLPTSRRDMVNDQISDPDLGVFAEQILTAKSVYKPEANTVDNIFAEMISSVNLGSATVEEAVTTGARRVDALFTR
jgi:multiple sugar transport system substrate-binding protein